jgi:hypothetical protein
MLEKDDSDIIQYMHHQDFLHLYSNISPKSIDMGTNIYIIFFDIRSPKNYICRQVYKSFCFYYKNSNVVMEKKVFIFRFLEIKNLNDIEMELN